MRTGWEPDAIWALFDGGHLGTNHQHEDKLSLLLHAYGHLLLTEGGNYAYDDSEMRRYCLSTRSHNTIRIDGLDQNRKGPFREWWMSNEDDEDAIIAEMNTPNAAIWRTTDDYDMAEAVYDEGYGPEAVSLATHRRKVIFLKNAPAPLLPCFVVIDRLLPNDGDEHEYQIMWHTNTAGLTISEDNGLISHSHYTNNKANLTVIAGDHPAFSLAVVTGQRVPEWQGWQSPYHGRQGTELPAPTADYRLVATGAVRVITLVYPLPSGTRCPVTRIAAEPTVDATRLTLYLENRESITLDESDFV